VFILAYVVDVVKAKRGLKNNLYWRGKTKDDLYKNKLVSKC
jgi:hypothetical protein